MIELFPVVASYLAAISGGAVLGIAIYRNNVDDGEATIQYLESQAERLNVELRTALDELEAAKAKLTRKPKAK